MSKIFTRSFRVRYSELDAAGWVSPAAYLRYLVETAYDWGEALGLGARDSERLGIFWLIRETEIRLLHPLRHNDRFDFTIWMVNWQRVRGTRCFELTSGGEVLAQGSQHIVCMDSSTLRPTSPPETLLENFRLEQPRVFPFERFPKIEPPATCFSFSRRVEWGDLDTLEHVNNAAYVTLAEEAAARWRAERGWNPAKFAAMGLTPRTRRVHIQYLSPALWGEALTFSVYPRESNATSSSLYVGLTRADGSLVCETLLDWELVERGNGPVRPLPPELSR